MKKKAGSTTNLRQHQIVDSTVICKNSNQSKSNNIQKKQESEEIKSEDKKDTN